MMERSAIFLTVNRDLDRDAVIDSRRIRQDFLLAVAIQPLALDNRGKILVADIEIDIAIDAVHAAFLGVLQDTVSAGIIRLVTPVRQPDRVAGFDVTGGMRRE